MERNQSLADHIPYKIIKYGYDIIDNGEVLPAQDIIAKCILSISVFIFLITL